MFTGLIEDLGTVAEMRGARLTVQTRFDDLKHGASVAVDGVCLTVVDLAPGRFTADVSAETLQRSTLGSLKAGARVNLERPMALGERLGGHLVLGHVDGVGEIVSRQTIGEGVRVELRVPRDLASLVVEKGSIALDGISLTVNEVEKNRFGINIVPHTLTHTTLGAKKPGDRVNLEADVFARYIVRAMELRT